MGAEPGFIGVEQAAQQPPKLIRFGGEVPPKLQSANDRFVSSYLTIAREHGGNPQLVGITTVVPTEKGKYNFWKKPPQSLTVFTFAAADADEATRKSTYSRTSEEWQHVMARSFLYYVQRGGILRGALTKSTPQHEQLEQHITRVKGLSFKDGETETRALLIERRLPGEQAFDRVIVIPHHRETDAEKVVESMNRYVAEGMGEGEEIMNTTLADLLSEQGKEDWTKKKRIFSADTVKALYHIARRVAKRRS